MFYLKIKSTGLWERKAEKRIRELGIGDWGLGIRNWELGIGNWEFGEFPLRTELQATRVFLLHLISHSDRLIPNS
jgi:hypothetical protein